MTSDRSYELNETDSIYVPRVARFVVSLIVGYGGLLPRTPEMAAAAALDLTRDEGSQDTVWFVYDRETGELHRFEQGDFDDGPVP